MLRKDKDGFFHLPPLTIGSFDQLGRYECVIEHALMVGQKIVTGALDWATLKGKVYGDYGDIIHDNHDVIFTFGRHYWWQNISRTKAFCIEPGGFT